MWPALLPSTKESHGCTEALVPQRHGGPLHCSHKTRAYTTRNITNSCWQNVISNYGLTVQPFTTPYMGITEELGDVYEFQLLPT
jgi:hypothetical protein